MIYNLTAHVVVRNEPFVWYAVRSVYDRVDKVMLCDTGSTDHTIDDIQQLLAEDHDGKICFSQVAMPDATGWTDATRPCQNKHVANDGIAMVRQQQIARTETDFFMLVDGDEVHRRESMQRIVEDVLPNWPNGKLCCQLPVTWHCDVDKTCRVGKLQGRLFRTREVVVVGTYPSEMIANASTRRYLWNVSQETFNASTRPFAHFEPWIKPWRRELRAVRPAIEPLPEVMIENPFYLRRFQEETRDAKT